MRQKAFITFIVTILHCFNASAQVGKLFESINSDGSKLTFKITSENTAMLMRDEKELGKCNSISVPESVEYKGMTLQVTEIEPGCFRFLNLLETISLPETITELKSVEVDVVLKRKYLGTRRYGMFANCENLKKVYLPNSLQKMEDLTFMECSSLKEIALSQELTEIGGGCFIRCKSLKNVQIPKKIKKISDTKWIYDKYDKTFSYAGFFEDCISLESVELPASVTDMDSRAFYGCKAIKRIKGFNSEIKIHTTRDYYGLNQYSSCELFQNSCISLDSITKTFSYFADKKIRRALDEWQQKREFESVAQYQTRVTNNNREKKLQELIEHYKEDYITSVTKDINLNFSLGEYDNDYHVFPITDGNIGTKYIKVPLEEEIIFQVNFSKASFIPTYCVVNDNIALKDISVKLNGKTYYAEQVITEANSEDFVIDMDDIELDLGHDQEQQNQSKTIPTAKIDRSLDHNIPSIATSNASTFAVIIGNEKYTQVAKVPYANNDAIIFAEYCKKTLGLPAKNVKVYENATYGAMIGAVSDIQKIAKAFKGDINVIFYYAGHGIPDEATGDGYLLPIDADGMRTEVCYPLSRLYKEFGGLGAKSVVAFMDACFSGSQRGNGMVVAARGVAIKAKSEQPTGNTIVFTAATDKQTAYPYEEKGHGLFTYYLLKKLRDTKGDCTLGELGSYICEEVAKQAVITNGKEQTPVVLMSDGISNSWKELKIVDTRYPNK